MSVILAATESIMIFFYFEGQDKKMLIKINSHGERCERLTFMVFLYKLK